ncbi:DNA polymerase III subunit gamma/tau [Paraglaciecola aquimarina]|uniref:DNA-directed DNA polymerase n=1 Tax=Paraglaciecola algarum TaxID=3050085 RepID=A0ABS9DA71_9ALTE|nr:DNA polymerase III subunit gamma/tau [Paraglaciecola sp. G1-23]MCF2949850.1 DNA polymerase III subunit gamma/tau [Paraglaciecola sp. G1-23]
MSYQVLARKWRPNRFGELVGQEHVVTAISNALDNNRLHHAYLFTGTRGVGKTTIARIFSKSLNCEQGLGATPCGQCGTCQEIENGNFIDLLEIDAASRTKVEDTRELLDNVQYKPSRGRYKVYLIDEVHMLSKHSFNALLKTLEEPPPHVKFLLATTDPQKLPVTILSRCLQFNLKALSRGQIAQQLEYVLGQEKLSFDKDALNQLARAAQGSMRDALSLTDQAIAQGNGVVGLQIVTDMLGLMDKNQVLKLVHAVVQKDSAEVMQQIEFMANQAPDFSQILAEMMSLLHQIALTQFVPDACKLETISARAIYQLAKSVPVEQIQLLYQIALSGKKDLPHAADPRTGLEMTLLRMLAFCPGNLKLDSVDIMSQTPSANSDIHSQLHSADISTEQPAPEPKDETNNLEPNQHNSTSILPENTQEPANPNQNPNKVDESKAVENTLVEVQPSESEQAQVNHPQVNQEISEPLDNGSDEEQKLFAQQQDIIAQAEDFGHHITDYHELEPVSLNPSIISNENQFTQFEQSSVGESSQVDDVQVDVNVPDANNQANSSPVNSTADLIALRNRLKQNKLLEEDNAKQVKKSEKSELPNLASIRKQNGAELNPDQQEDASLQTPKQEAFAQVESLPSESLPTGAIQKDDLSVTSHQSTSNEPEFNSEVTHVSEDVIAVSEALLSAQEMEQDNPFASEPIGSDLSILNGPPHSSSEIPPWAQDDIERSQFSQAKQESSSGNRHTQAINSSTEVSVPVELDIQPEAEVFDPNAHLDEDNIGEVDLEVPAFLPNKQKVIKSKQLDEWSQLIDDMQVNALTKQLALHSSFNREGNKVTLTLLEGKEHLDSETARDLLKQALSNVLNAEIELEIVMGQPINTPYAVQIKINHVRQDYACQVVNNDPGIQLLKQRFSASVVEQSIQAR